MLDLIMQMLYGGVISLLDYLSFHVMLCLVPAFFIAGAMAVFIPKQVVLDYLGDDSPKYISYPMAGIGGFLLAVCSCTVLPLFVGIWKKGAGLGPAITFLFAAPAVNLLALSYTGVQIGMDIAIARAILAFIFAMLIGYLMDLMFSNKSNAANQESSNPSKLDTTQDVTENLLGDPTRILENTISAVIQVLSFLIFFLTGLFLATIQYQNLTDLNVLEPRNTSVAITFALFQLLVWVIGLGAVFVLSLKSKNPTVVLFIWLVYILFTGTSQIKLFFDVVTIVGVNLGIAITNTFLKTCLTAIVTLGTLWYVNKHFTADQQHLWMEETYLFFKKIFPYLIIGVFIAGMFKELIIPTGQTEPTQLLLTFQSLVGKNTVLANLIGVLFGVFMYFPTLVEVPIAAMFLDLGMSRGVLLAYLLADPELSLQSILVTRKFLGDKRNSVYVLLVIIFTVLAGLIFGIIVSGEPVSLI